MWKLKARREADLFPVNCNSYLPNWISQFVELDRFCIFLAKHPWGYKKKIGLLFCPQGVYSPLKWSWEKALSRQVYFGKSESWAQGLEGKFIWKAWSWSLEIVGEKSSREVGAGWQEAQWAKAPGKAFVCPEVRRVGATDGVAGVWLDGGGMATSCIGKGIGLEVLSMSGNVWALVYSSLNCWDIPE